MYIRFWHGLANYAYIYISMNERKSFHYTIENIIEDKLDITIFFI